VKDLLTDLLADGPAWAVVVVVLVVALVRLFSALARLISLRMTYRAMHRLASIARTGTFRGPWGTEWKATSEPDAQPEPLRSGASKRKRWQRWLRRHHPPDSS
jgi:hypothetical protein